MIKKTAVIGTLVASMGIVIVIPGNAEAATIQTKAYNFAHSEIGNGYAKNGQSTTGLNTYDCSGLVWRSFKQAGKSWPRYNANDQRRKQTKDITVNQRQVGDLIFFKKKGYSTYTHVGIYAGGGYMISAVSGSTVKGVHKGKVVDGYWNKYYNADYRRVK